MKKNFLVAAMLLVSVLCVAKKRVIVIREVTGVDIGNTEVHDHGDFGTDTLTVLPGSLATHITFTARTAEGALLYHQSVPANIKMIYTLDLPDLPNGYLFQIKDNNGVVYTNYEIQ